MGARFEADLDPETGNPRVRLNFPNGWTASLVLYEPMQSRCEFLLASLAAFPTGRVGAGVTELGETEASPAEVVSFLAAVSAPEACA